MKTDLESTLRQNSGRRLLFLGRESLFTHQEAERFLKTYDMDLTTDPEEKGIVGVVEHHRLNPVEEDISYRFYDRKVPLFKLEEFERLMSEQIKEDELLMVLKLGDDQERLLRLIDNTHISDALFLKLLGMYRWSEDTEEDSNEDRGVVMATLRRFLNYKTNEEDLLYSALTLKRLAVETEDPRLLYTLLGFPNFRFMQKGKQWITLREVVATSAYIDRETIRKLLRFRDEKIMFFLAANRSVPREILEELSEKNIESIDEALASNISIGDTLFAKLLSKGGSIRDILLHYQPVDRKRYGMIEKETLTSGILSLLGANELLAPELIPHLADSDRKGLLRSLAANSAVPAELLDSFYNRKDIDLTLPLSGNKTTPISLLEAIYRDHEAVPDIQLALAANTSTPEAILRALFDLDRYEINERLAANESVPLELLNILKIDTRLRNALTGNKTFTDSITRDLGL
jgi:hypothetical protein